MGMPFPRTSYASFGNMMKCNQNAAKNTFLLHLCFIPVGGPSEWFLLNFNLSWRFPHLNWPCGNIQHEASNVTASCGKSSNSFYNRICGRVSPGLAMAKCHGATLWAVALNLGGSVGPKRIWVLLQLRLKREKCRLCHFFISVGPCYPKRSGPREAVFAAIPYRCLPMLHGWFWWKNPTSQSSGALYLHPFLIPATGRTSTFRPLGSFENRAYGIPQYPTISHNISQSHGWSPFSHLLPAQLWGIGTSPSDPGLVTSMEVPSGWNRTLFIHDSIVDSLLFITSHHFPYSNSSFITQPLETVDHATVAWLSTVPWAGGTPSISQCQWQEAVRLWSSTRCDEAAWQDTFWPFFGWFAWAKIGFPILQDESAMGTYYSCLMFESWRYLTDFETGNRWKHVVRWFVICRCQAT